MKRVVTTAHDGLTQSKNIYYGILSLFYSVREVAKPLQHASFPTLTYYFGAPHARNFRIQGFICVWFSAHVESQNFA